ncbi:MAG: lipopolysaccharide heptosyltransferase I [Planctomycetaceae bacterium]|nr:MAG: lipopolysaccharide heptosyltransferase I [Planctomycetaceae bacterium]
MSVREEGWWQEVEARRVLILKPSALGDVVQALPLLTPLRQRFPHAHFTWLIQSRFADLVQQHPQLDDVWCISRRPSWGEVWQVLRRLRQGRFDLVLDLQGLCRTGILTWATQARWRVGLQTAREGAHFSYNRVVPDSGWQIPAAQRYWRVAEVFGVGHIPPQAYIPYTPQDDQQAEQWLGTLPRPLIGVQLGAQWETKRWPPERFAAAVQPVLQQFPGSVILVGSREEEPLARRFCLTGNFSSLEQRVLSLVGRTTLRQLTCVLQRLDVLLTNDSGPMHLAAALGTPIVGLFTCTDAYRSGPVGDGHRCLQAAVPCAACYHKRCPLRGAATLRCLTAIPVNHVTAALIQVLQRGIASQGLAA